MTFFGQLDLAVLLIHDEVACLLDAVGIILVANLTAQLARQLLIL
jgi:hypothetical protein